MPKNPRPIASSPRPRLRLDLLQAFEASARHLSFTKAGEELFLSQSAISRQIQQLEDNLGTALFERRRRALALTDAGHVMLRAVEESLELMHEAASRVRPRPARREVAITCTAGFASFWLIPRLSTFTDAHPGVDVRISATPDLVDLERSTIDVAVRFVPFDQGRGTLLFEEQIQPMCAPSLVRARSRPLRVPADLARHTLLTIDVPSVDRFTADWEPWLRVMDLHHLEAANTIRFTQYVEAVAAACEGQGVVIGRLPLLADLVESGRLVAPFDSPAASRRAYFVMLAKHAERNADAVEFASWLEQQAKAVADSGLVVGRARRRRDRLTR